MIVETRPFTEASTSNSAALYSFQKHEVCLPDGLGQALKRRESIICITNPGARQASFYEALNLKGYNIKTLNFNNLFQSVSWNPFRYIFDKQGVLSMTDALFGSVNSLKPAKNEVYTAKLLVSATIAFCLDLLEYLDDDSRSQIITNFNGEEANLKQFAKFLAQAKERNRDNEDYISVWQEHFNALDMLKPDAFSMTLYRQYLEASKPKIMPGIDIAMEVIEPIVPPLVQDVFYKDETGLDRIREQRNAVLVVRPRWNSNYLPLFTLACQQIVRLLTTPLRERDYKKPVNLVVDKSIAEMKALCSRSDWLMTCRGVTVYENA